MILMMKMKMKDGIQCLGHAIKESQNLLVANAAVVVVAATVFVSITEI